MIDTRAAPNKTTLLIFLFPISVTAFDFTPVQQSCDVATDPFIFLLPRVEVSCVMPSHIRVQSMRRIYRSWVCIIEDFILILRKPIIGRSSSNKIVQLGPESLILNG